MGSFALFRLHHDTALAALADNWAEQNVESLDLEPFSIFNLYRRLLARRRKYRALRTAGTKP